MDIYKFLDRLTEAWQAKVFFCLVLNYLFGAYNAGLGALACLVALDWVTKWGVISREAGGFWIAWKTDAINSHGMRDGLKKILWYMAILIAAHQLEQFSFLGYTIGHSATEIMSAYLGLIEAKSILENLRDMGMKGMEPFISMLGEKQNQITGGNTHENIH